MLPLVNSVFVSKHRFELIYWKKAEIIQDDFAFIITAPSRNRERDEDFKGCWEECGSLGG
jgi:hypothetical protein